MDNGRNGIGKNTKTRDVTVYSELNTTVQYSKMRNFNKAETSTIKTISLLFINAVSFNKDTHAAIITNSNRWGANK